MTLSGTFGASPGVPAEVTAYLFASGLALFIFIVKLKVKKIISNNYIASMKHGGKGQMKDRQRTPHYLSFQTALFPW